MSSIKTYTGVMFDPVNPESELIDILDFEKTEKTFLRLFRTLSSGAKNCADVRH
jgi:hypothetical protein